METMMQHVLQNWILLSKHYNNENNGQKDFVEHYTNIFPEVGSLTSTARTFILDGITTEYETQVMGTALDKGRLYAQYLKKSSRLRYDSSQEQAHENIVLPLVISSWVGDNLELRTKPQSENNNKIVNAYTLVYDDTNVLADNTYFDSFNGKNRYQDMAIVSDKLSNKKFNNRDEYGIPLWSLISIIPTSGSGNSSVIATNKVLPLNELRTHPKRGTFVPGADVGRKSEYRLIHKPISNKKLNFSYSSKIYYQLHDDVANNNKLNILSDEKLSTTTYYGFADFTTIVGESVIIFSPGPSTQYVNFKQVTSITNYAALSGIMVQGDKVHTRPSSTTDLKNITKVMTMAHATTQGLVTLSVSEMRESFKNKVIDDGFAISYEKASITSGNKWLQISHARIFNNGVSSTKISVNGYDKSWSSDGNMFKTSIYTSVTYSRPSGPEVLEVLTSLSRAGVIRKTRIPIQNTEVVTYGDHGEEIQMGYIAIKTNSDIVGNNVDIQPLQTISYDKVIPSGDYINYPKYCLGTSQSIFAQNSKTITQIDELFKPLFSIKEGDTFDNSAVNHPYCLETKPTVILPSVLKLSNNKTQIMNVSQLGKLLEQGPDGGGLTRIYNNTILVNTEFKFGNKLNKKASTSIQLHNYIKEVSNQVKHSFTTKETERNIVYTTEGDLTEDVELIYKTLFTTYTYLATFFKDDKRTSISSNTEVFTNIFTSTIQMGSEDIDPTTVVTHIQPAKNKDPEELLKNISAEKRLNDNSKAKNLKCIIHECIKETNTKNTLASNINKPERIYFTSYTHFTTVFVEDEMKIMSRMEISTNFVTDGITSTEVFNKKKTACEIMKSMSKITAKDNRLYHEINTFSNNLISIKVNISEQKLLNFISIARTPKTTANNYNFSNNTPFNIITIVRPNSSGGDRRMNQKLELVGYQAVSEGNTNLLKPSATFLLQTTFTTFTYYTTVYNADMSNIIRRLETRANVGTETVQSSKTVDVEEATMLLTRITPYSLWTKISKNGKITSLNRKTQILNNISDTPSNNSNADNVTTNESVLKPASYYTTYTYYTTSYGSDESIIHSRFETITNVIKPTQMFIPKKGDFVSDMKGVIDNSSTNSNPPFIDVVNRGPLPLSSENQVILCDCKKVVDAEGISTLYFTTAIYHTIAIDGSPSEFASSSSSLYVDEAKKSLILRTLTTRMNGGDILLAQQYKTGLVRLVEGMRIGNQTTTLYQSKVIGAFIENRYAQIIESTSSVYLKSNSFTSTSRVPTMSLVSTQSAEIAPNDIRDPLEHTISSKKCSTYASSKNDNNDEINEVRLPFQLIKRTFTPVICSFISHNRAQLGSQKKGSELNGATIVTIIDFTPTITVTPAIKSIGRFSSSRGGIFSNNSLSPRIAVGAITSTPRRISVSLRPSAQSSRQAAVLLRNPSASGFRSAHVRTRFKPTNLAIPDQKNIETEDELYLTSEKNSQVELSPFKSLDNWNQSNPLPFRGTVNRLASVTATNHLTTEDSFSKRQKVLIARMPIPFTATKSPRAPQIGRVQGTTCPKSILVLPQNQNFHENIVNNIEEKMYASIESVSDYEYGSDYYGEDGKKNKDDYNENNRFRRSKPKINKSGSMERKMSKISKILQRVRREARTSFQTRSSFRNRFRHPNFSSNTKIRSTIEDVEPVTFSQESLASLHRTKGHSITRYTGPHRKQATVTTAANTNLHGPIRPTRSLNGRSQFTLRDKNATAAQKSTLRPHTSNYRRSQNISASRRLSSSNSNNRRLKALTGNSLSQDFPSRSILPRSRNSLGRTRTAVRGRNRNEQNDEQGVLPYENIITATHVIPAEVTIPVVNGKITEYKNVVTEKTSTELLGPEQYTSFVASNGQTILALKRADSSVNYVGATEITQYVLHESPTTTVIFTPTTIRGRKTSFSHVIPSTVYSVENVISTSPPKISANIPLANILLSQLLLGNIDLHAANPLLTALSAAGTPVPNQLAVNALGAQVPIPVTEYRTHTSTYVTTVYEGMSTILSVMFQGKKILTTVYDTSEQTITVTEFITDTIVTTPTQQLFATQTSQVNSLLLQQLLLQQELQSKLDQPKITTLHSGLPQLILTDKLHGLDKNNIRPSNENVTTNIGGSRGNKTGRKKTRKPGKIQKRKHQTTQSETLENSNIITLYVSGKRPGEFSTILSTLISDHDSTIHKRHACLNVRQTVDIYDIDDFYTPDKSKCL